MRRRAVSALLQTCADTFLCSILGLPLRLPPGDQIVHFQMKKTYTARDTDIYLFRKLFADSTETFILPQLQTDERTVPNTDGTKK